jgi:hypothetical protein
MLTVNTNPSTGVRYGTVYLQSLAGWAFEEFLYHGTNLSYEAARKDFEQEFRAAYEGEPDDLDDALDEALDGFNEDYTGEEETYRLEKDGLELELSYLGGAPMVWVLKSPHTARVRLCSPCVPNAGDLGSPDEGGVEAYTLPPEWFERD